MEYTLLLDQGACARWVDQSSLQLQEEEGVYVFEERPFTGTAWRRHANGSLAEEVQYVNGEKHGLHFAFFANVRVSLVARYREGKLHGESLRWWDHGALRSVSYHYFGQLEAAQRHTYVENKPFKRLGKQ
jgi:antitoxin component YwqK of YwqJK toxin-antitoxin module